MNRDVFIRILNRIRISGKILLITVPLMIVIFALTYAGSIGIMINSRKVFSSNEIYFNSLSIVGEMINKNITDVSEVEPQMKELLLLVNDTNNLKEPFLSDVMNLQKDFKTQEIIKQTNL